MWRKKNANSRRVLLVFLALLFSLLLLPANAYAENTDEDSAGGSERTLASELNTDEESRDGADASGEESDVALEAFANDWKSVLTNNYSRAKQLAGRSSFNGYCSLAVSYELWAYGITASREQLGNGIDAASHFRNGGTTSGGYPIAYTAGSRSSGWSPFDTATGNGSINGIYIMSYTSNSSAYGHVSFLVVENGTVYVAESYAYSGNPEGTGMALPYSSFKSQWSRYYPNVTGVVRFGSSGPINHDPIGVVDGVAGGAGSVRVSGWAFDPDDPSASLTVHIYIGGDASSGEGHVVTANASRPDVNAAYGISGNHGFEVTLETSKTGNQPVVVYLINVPSSNINPPLEAKYVSIAPGDSEAPVISDVQVSDVSMSGYTITCKVTDNKGVTRVQFPTWTTHNGQDDLAGDWPNNKVVSGTKGDGDIWTFRVNASDHNGEVGEYITDIYAYDAAGNAAKYASVNEGLVPSTELPEGRYTIENSLQSGMVLDVYGSLNDDNANVLLYKRDDVPNQQFDIIRNDDSSYLIIASHSNKAVEVSAALRTNGANVAQYTQNGHDAQRWYARKMDDGTWMFQNKHSGYLLDILDDGSGGFDVKQYKYHGDSAQRWKLIPAKWDISKATIEISNPKDSYTFKERPIPIVKFDKGQGAGIEVLEEGKDYEVSEHGWDSNRTIDIKGIGDFTGFKYYEYKRKFFAITSAMIDDIPDQTFTGDYITTDVAIRDGERVIWDPPDGDEAVRRGDYYVWGPNGDISDFRLKKSYENNLNVGTATITVELGPEYDGVMTYGGTASKTFKIVPRSIADAKVTAANKTYTGKALKPAPTVKIGDRTLVLGTDYTVSYKNNTNAGTATVTVTGKGNYKGTATGTFKISGASLAKASVTASDQTYTGSALKPTPSVTLGSVTLKSGTDYTVAYSNNTAVGTATVTVTGKGNYTGTAKGTFAIKAASLAKATVTVADQTWTGKALKPSPTVKLGSVTLKSGTDYTVAYGSNTNAGTATVTITGKGNYTGTAKGTFTIKAASLAKATVTAADQTYTSKALKPAPTVKLGSVTLVSGTDYTVAYSNNTAVGTATITVTGKGNYTGTAKGTFAIKAASLAKATVTAADQTYTGKALTPAPTVKLGSVTLKSGTDYTVKYANNTNVGTATITITGKGNYTGTAKGTFAINDKPKTDLSGAVVTVADQTYTGKALKPTVTVKLGTTTLKSGTDYTVAFGSNTNAGTATVTVTGKGDYTGTAKGTFAIKPASIAKATVTTADQIWTGKALKPAPTVKLGSVTLKSGTDYTVKYANNTNAGKATVTVTGKGNYTGTAKGTFTITKAAEDPLTNPFIDVTEKTAHYDDILWLADRGISAGWSTDAGKEFRPNANVARGDMAAFLFRLAKLWNVAGASDDWRPSIKTIDRFSDVSSSTAHAQAIWWLAENGISTGWTVKGSSRSEFRPNAPVARGDMAAFLYRLAQKAGRGTGIAGDPLAFTDVADGTAHHDAIWWMAGAGISQGWPVAGTSLFEFRPNANVARGDMAAFLHRLDGLK